jgi:hypothetical protein
MEAVEGRSQTLRSPPPDEKSRRVALLVWAPPVRPHPWPRLTCDGIRCPAGTRAGSGSFDSEQIGEGKSPCARMETLIESRDVTGLRYPAFGHRLLPERKGEGILSFVGSR